MPYLCKMCKSTVDKELCPDCGAPATWYDVAYELTITKTCTKCGSSIKSRINREFPDILSEDLFSVKFCPRCNGLRMHETRLIAIDGADNPDDVINNMYMNELRKK